MHAILDLQLGILDNAVEKEWIEFDTVGLGKLGIDRIEPRGIVGPHVGRRQHAGKQHFDATRLQLFDHRNKVLAAFLGRDATQGVVGAKFENDALGAVRNRPIDPRQTAGGRVAGDAGIADRHVVPLRAQGLFQPGGEGVFGRQLVARHQAVAEADEAERFGTAGHRHDHNRRDRQQKCTETFYSHERALKSVKVSRSGNLHIVHIGQFPLAKTMIDLKNADLTLGQAAASVHVLKGMDLSIDAGESVGIVGPSGSGKSTLLMVLAGLERLDSGEIVIDGTPLHGLSEDRVAEFRGRNIGIVFQSFHLIPNMTALENVAVPLELANVRDAFEIARQELISVGLGERLSHYPGQLSGGEQQRVAIARALAPSPKLLIADEPTGNLDTETGKQVADLIFSKQAERDMTLVLVTHDASLAARCSRQVRVRSGEIVSGAGQERPVSASISKAVSA